MPYNHKTIEAKWQERWEKEGVFVASDKVKPEKKKYILDMFPYPSGAGLHVGHPEGYTATDIYSRYLRMKGYQVLHPMGWDAFGLPAENYAIKNKAHPRASTENNIKTFTRQIKALGFSYDWSREVNTSDPNYYKWTQWLFLQLYNHGLAYKKAAPVNWCADCQTVLANEQVVDGECERCHNKVVQKNLEQWFFKITGSGKHGSYPERLLSNLEKLDWPEPIKTMQRNWIGRSEGAIINFQIPISKSQTNSNNQISNSKKEIEIFTTRPDTLFGATYMVLAPEHPLIQELKDQIANWPEVEKYIKKSAAKSQLERTDLAKAKTGVELKCVKAINPGNGEEIPVWIADYVLLSYGTGAIMAVPAHDDRDWEFAKKFKLKVKCVIDPTGLISADTEELLEFKRKNILEGKECFPIRGKLINSGEFNGLTIFDAQEKIIEWLEKNKLGIKSVSYKLRDWLISRQRYWGAPIPIIYCDTCARLRQGFGGQGEHPVPEEDLPVVLPDDVDFRPKGESPLQRSESFHKVKCPKCGGQARRESDTMDTFVDSSWYFLRYTDPKNDKEFASKEKIKTWLPVDTYVGGAEHAVLHLMYARFFCMALHDFGYLDWDEPFLQLRNQGLILGPDGQKMSKSRGNVINPDEVVENLGADTMRLYEMFMGPLEDAKPWDTNGIIGVRRFLDRVWGMEKFQTSNIKHQKNSKHQTSKNTVEQELNKLIKKVGEDIESFDFNTAVSQFMIFVNAVYKADEISKEHLETFLKVLSPFAPHIANELWEQLGHKKLIEYEEWPEYNPKLIQDKDVVFMVQINGKVRGQVIASPDASEKEVAVAAQGDAKARAYLDGQEIIKQIFVAGKLINFLIKK